MIGAETTGYTQHGNNVVAPSDYRAALRAIEETFQEEADANDPEAQELFHAVQASLLQNLSRIVQPTTDDQAYHDIVDPYHIVEDADDDEDEDEDESDTEKPRTEENVEEQQEEIDEADLLDKKALQDAQRLRTRVRELSQRIQLIRERTLERSRFVPEPTKEPSLSVETESPTELDDEFRASLLRLSELVHNPKWATLPRELQKLQDTLEVVQKEQSRPLSQTEVAIISRSNSSEDNDDLYGLLSQNEDEEILSAEDRLAAFFHLLQ
jgi:hypothetical protein